MKHEEVLEKIDFDKYSKQSPYLGLKMLRDKGNIALIECGGGYSTKVLLAYAIKHNCDVITIDDLGIHGNQAGDYTKNDKLFELLEKKFPFYKWYKEDVHQWFKTHRPKIDYYFDDGTHEPEYLIPLFKTIFPLSNEEAVLGSHDVYMGDMYKFRTFLKDRKWPWRIIENSMFVKVKR
jgi:hypothetical protein